MTRAWRATTALLLVASGFVACGGAGPTDPSAALARHPDPTRVGEATAGAAPRLVLLRGGRRLLVWLSREPAGVRLWASASEGDHWRRPLAARRDVPGVTARMDVVADSAGGAVALVHPWKGEPWLVRIDATGRPLVPSSLGVSHAVALGRDESGRPLLAWVTGRRGSVCVQPADEWGRAAPEQVGYDDNGQGAYGVRLVGGEPGPVSVLWFQDQSGRHPGVVLRESRKTASGWTGMRALSGHAWYVLDLQTATGPAGDAVALWRYGLGPVIGTVGARLDAGREWLGTIIVHPNSVGAPAALGVDAEHNAVGLWTRSEGASATQSLWASHGQRAVAWSPVHRIDDDARGVSEPRIAITPKGAALAAWRVDDQLWGAEADLVGRWTRPERLDGAAGGALDHDLLRDETGRVWVAWSAFDGRRVGVWARALRPRE